MNKQPEIKGIRLPSSNTMDGDGLYTDGDNATGPAGEIREGEGTTDDGDTGTIDDSDEGEGVSDGEGDS